MWVVADCAITEALVIGAPALSTEPCNRKASFWTTRPSGGWLSVTLGGPVALQGGGGPTVENSMSSTARPPVNPPPVVTDTSRLLIVGVGRLTTSGVWIGVGLARAGRVAFAVPTTCEDALRAVSRTPSGAASGLEKPTQARTLCCAAVKVARTGEAQNSAATQGSTATVPEWVNPGIGLGGFE